MEIEFNLHDNDNEKEYIYVDNDFDQYIVNTKAHAKYPKERALEYLVAGLGSEVGEVLGKYKKAIRDSGGDLDTSSFRAELGDVLWYIARIHDELGLSLYETAIDNVDKLNKRLDKGTIHGDGDDR